MYMMLRFKENSFETPEGTATGHQEGGHEEGVETLKLPEDILKRRNLAREQEAKAAARGLEADNEIQGNVFLAENFARGFATMTEAAARGAAKGRAAEMSS